MKNHTSFQIGGPADFFCKPHTLQELQESLDFADRYSLPLQIIGDGTNILVSDKGIRGVTVTLTGLNRMSVTDEGVLSAQAGACVSDLSEEAATRSLTGIEFFYSLPGSLGGAVFMNARCYEKSASDVVSRIKVLQNGKLETLDADQCGFAYKDSVFQHNGEIIVEAVIPLSPGDNIRIKNAMTEYKADRSAKGHFTYPCAGSAFKNNRAFGEPSGKIIDSLGLKGYSLGGARVSPLHANIVINSGNATAGEVRRLLEEVKEKVLRACGLELEEEVRYIGEWGAD